MLTPCVHAWQVAVASAQHSTKGELQLEDAAGELEILGGGLDVFEGAGGKLEIVRVGGGLEGGLEGELGPISGQLQIIEECELGAAVGELEITEGEL